MNFVSKLRVPFHLMLHHVIFPRPSGNLTVCRGKLPMNVDEQTVCHFHCHFPWQTLTKFSKSTTSKHHLIPLNPAFFMLKSSFFLRFPQKNGGISPDPPGKLGSPDGAIWNCSVLLALDGRIQAKLGWKPTKVDVTIVVTINGMVIFAVLWLILPQKSSSAV